MQALHLCHVSIAATRNHARNSISWTILFEVSANVCLQFISVRILGFNGIFVYSEASVMSDDFIDLSSVSEAVIKMRLCACICGSMSICCIMFP